MRIVWPIVVGLLTAGGSYLLMPSWAGRLQVEGLVLEVLGAVVATQALSGKPFWLAIVILINALVRGCYATGTVRFSAGTTDAKEDALRALQGLSLIALGFVLQLAGTLLARESIG